MVIISGEKKIEKSIKPRTSKNNNRKNRTIKKKPIKPIRNLKKPTDSVRFRFYKPETKKTTRTELKPKKTRAKPEKTAFVIK